MNNLKIQKKIKLIINHKIKSIQKYLKIFKKVKLFFYVLFLIF